MRAQRDTYLDAVSRRDELTAKEAWAMHGASSDFSGTPTSKLGNGTASPPYHFRCRTVTVAYFGSGDGNLDNWTRAAYDREPLSRKDVEALIDRAKTAKWPHTKVVRGHFRKHQQKLGIADQTAFSQSAVDLIRRGNRDVYISMRKGVLNATFVRPALKQKPGFMVTSVDLVENKITSHHWWKNLESSEDEVPAQKQPVRGIMKWLIDYLG